MTGMRFGRKNLGLMSQLALLLVAVLAPATMVTAASAQASDAPTSDADAPSATVPDAYAPVAGTWTGPIVWPNGSASMTVWTINPDGTFSVQTDEYTAVGSLQPVSTGYVFTYERNGEQYKGMLADQQANGRRRLVGRGDAPNGPMDLVLTHAGG